MLCRGRGGCALDGGDVGGRRRRRRGRRRAPAQSVRRRGAARRVLAGVPLRGRGVRPGRLLLPDGVEAYLRDGEMVAEWAVAATRGAEALLASASPSTASNVPSALRTPRTPRPRCSRPRRTCSGCSARAPTPRASPSRSSSTEAPAAGGPDGAGSDAASMRPKASDVVRRREPGLRARRGAGVARARGARRRHHAGRARRTRGVDRRGPRAPSGGGGGERGRARGRRTEAPGRASDLAVSPPSMTVRCSWTICCRARARIPPVPVQERRGGGGARLRRRLGEARRAHRRRCLFLYYLLDAGAPADGAPASDRAERAFAAAPVRADRRRRSAGRLGLREATRRGARSGAEDGARGSAGEVCRRARRARPRRRRRWRRRARRRSTSRAELDETLEADASSAKSAASAFAQESDLAVTVRLECGLATEAFLEAAAADG